MRNRRYAKLQWGQTGRQLRTSTRSGATPFREGARPRLQSVGHVFHAGLHRTVLELDQAETRTREFLLRRAKGGDAFAVRLLHERYRLRVATVAEVRHENQRRALEALPGARGVPVPSNQGRLGAFPDPR